MKLNKIITLFVFLVLPIAALAQSQNNVEGDRQALVDLYNSANGSNWDNNSGWTNGNPSNAWHGVEVDSDGRVIRLDLFNNNLSGSLPESIGNLRRLEYLNVKQNSLTGEIPQSIGNFVNLKWLLLSGVPSPKDPETNPEKAQHPGKTNTATNDFTGTIPSSIGNLRSLEQIELSGSSLTGGFPEEFGNLTELRGVHMSWNRNMTGGLPESISNLTKLEKFYISYNSLTGPLPANLGNLTEVRQLWADANDFSGVLPDLRGMTKLKEISFHRNENLAGDFPSYWGNGNYNNLIGVQFSWTNIGGQLPDFANLPEMRQFAIAGGNLTGEIPKSLTSATNMIIFQVGWNNLEGELPQEGWENWRNTRYIQVSHNNLTGPIPDNFPNARDIYLHENNFSSVSTEALINLAESTKLESVNISGNKIPYDQIEPAVSPLSDAGINFSYGNQDPEDDDGSTNEPTAPSAPSLQSPSSNATGVSVNPTFSWSSVSSDSYTLRVYTSSGSLVFENTGSGTSYSTPSSRTLDHDTEYSWRVRATRDGLNSDWSSSRSFTTESDNEPEPTAPAVPSLQSPSNGASTVSVNPDFSWSSVNAESYTLRVYTSGGSLVFENTGSGTSYSTPSSRTLDHDTEYSWRVRATRDGLNSDWSSSRSFRTEASDGSGGDDGGSGGSGGGDNNPLTSPDLTSPKDGETGVSLTPTLQWESLDADYYILHLNTPTTESLVVDAEVNGTSYSVKSNESLNPETLYKWRVRGVKDGVEGEWSTIAEFTTQSEDSGNGNNGKGPQKATPAKDEKKVKKNAAFTWESVEGAESYTIEVRESSTYSLFAEEEVTDTVYVSNQRMKGNTEYTWRVRATVEGQIGEWSDEWEFTTEDENEENAFVVELDQNYPNPFNPSTNIRFTLSETQEVSLKVYDMAGRLVASLVDSNTLTAGTHSASFNAQSLASGIYFYRLITPGEIVTRKMTLMK